MLKCAQALSALPIQQQLRLAAAFVCAHGPVKPCCCPPHVRAGGPHGADRVHAHLVRAVHREQEEVRGEAGALRPALCSVYFVRAVHREQEEVRGEAGALRPALHAWCPPKHIPRQRARRASLWLLWCRPQEIACCSCARNARTAVQRRLSVRHHACPQPRRRSFTCSPWESRASPSRLVRYKCEHLFWVLLFRTSSMLHLLVQPCVVSANMRIRPRTCTWHIINGCAATSSA